MRSLKELVASEKHSLAYRLHTKNAIFLQQRVTCDLTGQNETWKETVVGKDSVQHVL